LSVEAAEAGARLEYLRRIQLASTG